jgi:hypothetical protein
VGEALQEPHAVLTLFLLQLIRSGLHLNSRSNNIFFYHVTLLGGGNINEGFDGMANILVNIALISALDVPF